jgi:hypothetical protein
MSCCERTLLNGVGANTEGGRLRQLEKNLTFPVCATAARPPVQGNQCLTCIPSNSIQKPITPAESSRIYTLMVSCGTGSQAGQVTQSRARELLGQSQSRRQFVTEDVRIAAVIQDAVSCSTNPFDTSSRFSEYARIPDPFPCPVLPPPPAPPARACPLTKNQKY